MDLRNNQITIGEIMRSPHWKTIQARYPIVNHPMVRSHANMRLQNVLVLAQGYLPRGEIDRLLAELRGL